MTFIRKWWDMKWWQKVGDRCHRTVADPQFSMKPQRNNTNPTGGHASLAPASHSRDLPIQHHEKYQRWVLSYPKRIKINHLVQCNFNDAWIFKKLRKSNVALLISNISGLNNLQSLNADTDGYKINEIKSDLKHKAEEAQKEIKELIEKNKHDFSNKVSWAWLKKA